ncbi:MAG: hypothetical protein KKA84_04245 [Bacteroidetes bacterium]|nr:hypothetical protein [Bacteroidota bacterium]
MPSEQKIISTIDEFYEVISGSAGEEREWDKLRLLFCEGAVLTPYVFSDNVNERSISYNIESYINRVKKIILSSDFNERGFNYRIDIYGNIANVYSEYSAQINTGNETYMKKGINLIQLLLDVDNWKIISMLWENTSG